jgi:hypothetical protein
MPTLAAALGILERARGEAERAAAVRDHYSTLFDMAPDAYLVTDRYAFIRLANAVFVPLLERRGFRCLVNAAGRHTRWRCSAFSLEVRRSPSGLCWRLR